MSDKTDSKGPSKKADDKKPSEKKANDKVTSTKTDHKRTGDRETSEKKASEKTTGEKKHTGDKTSDKKANDKMENLKSETAKKENDKKTTNTKTDKAENKNATFKVDDEKTYLTIPTPSEPADSISRVSLTSDIFHDSELSNSNKLKRKRDDNTEPSWALATFAADDDTRQQNHEEKKYEARKYLNGFQKQYKLSDKAHSFVTDIARALALHAVGLPLDTGVLDLLQCEIVLSPGARWDSETGADERFLGFGIKCPPEKEIKINCEVVRDLTEKIFKDVYVRPENLNLPPRDVYVRPENLYLPPRVELALWEKTGCPVDPGDLKTSYNTFGWTKLDSEDERFCADLELRKAVPLQKLFLSYITLYE